MKIWACKIGATETIPPEADRAMREAAAKAYKEITGKSPDFIFAGWGARLKECERAVVENRMPPL